jgi:hypothetical protein
MILGPPTATLRCEARGKTDRNSGPSPGPNVSIGDQIPKRAIAQ